MSEIPKNGAIITGRVWPPGDTAPNIVTIENITNTLKNNCVHIYSDNQRYEKESNQLAALAIQQLNLKKNKIKPDFEDLQLATIWELITEEFEELRNELYGKPEKDYQRISEELGDLTGCLVGLLAKLNKMKGEG